MWQIRVSPWVGKPADKVVNHDQFEVIDTAEDYAGACVKVVDVRNARPWAYVWLKWVE